MYPYETILNNLQEAVLLFDHRGKVIYLNKWAEEFFNCNFLELSNRSAESLFSASSGIAELIKKTLHEGRPYRVRDFQLTGLKDTSMDLYSCPIYAEDLPYGSTQKDHRQSNGAETVKEVKAVLLCLRENSYIADPEDYHFDSLLYLLGSIAHEIKNPLSGIRGAAQLLLAKITDLQDGECLKMIIKEADRLNGILQSYLTMTRRPVFNIVNIHEVLEHALKVLSPIISDSSISVTKFYDPSLPCILGDESKLLQVFINLLKNAVEALDKKRGTKRISIVSRLSNEYVVIYEGDQKPQDRPKKKRQRWIIVDIQDSGVGLDKEEMRRIFLPFYTGKKGGSGLGLTLSKKIIKDHGGIIKVRSQKNKGSEFSVYLPMRVNT